MTSPQKHFGNCWLSNPWPPARNNQPWATPFGSYDRAFIEAVETRWHHLLDNNLITPRSGKVACEFKLTYDGRIIDMKIQDNEVGEILTMLCRGAIEDNQLYPKWPDDMRRAIGTNTRDIRFTFYYN